MDKTYILFIVILVTGYALRSPKQDLVFAPPGFGLSFNTDIYAGYLKTTNFTSTHYIFVQSVNGASNRDPITLWLNGQPGCTSKIGFLKQIGPYLITEGTPYRLGDQLTYNPYSWYRLSNLLFIDTPIGVGYTTNQNTSYLYNDENTAQFNLNALLDFFNKFPEYRMNSFYLAGEYYAGKIIPDLVLKITNYNAKSQTKINLKAILIGNGIMDLSSDNLEKSQINYIYSHNFVDPTIDKYWELACQADPTSAGCTFFLRRYDDMLSTVNYHNIYGACYKQNPTTTTTDTNSQVKNINSLNYNNKYNKCQYYRAVQQYFQLNWASYHSMPPSVPFTACNQTIFDKYEKNQLGSMNQYREIFKNSSIRVQFYSGDWDDVVPYTNTIKNLDNLGFKQNSTIVHWINANNHQHIGFKRNFQKDNTTVKLWIVKGAGHEVPQQKPQVAYQLFRDFLFNAS